MRRGDDLGTVAPGKLADLLIVDGDPSADIGVLADASRINAVLKAGVVVHGALPQLPFGGVGQSGSGRHHGIEGFREFSNLRGVFVRGEGDLIEAFAPPYGPTAQAIIDAFFCIDFRSD